jgi:hypothetical protein
MKSHILKKKNWRRNKFLLMKVIAQFKTVFREFEFNALRIQYLKRNKKTLIVLRQNSKI